MARIRRLTGGRAWALRLSALFVLAAIVALIVAVLPAFGALVDKDPVDLGGQDDDCSAIGYPALDDFRVENPRDGTFTDPETEAEFTIDVLPGAKSFNLDGTKGASVFAIVVKGGQKSVKYDYAAGGFPDGISQDLTGIEAPDKDKGNGLFNLSHVSFCYELLVTDISGTVWHDNDQNGVIGAGNPAEPLESVLPGWTVNLYDADGFVASDLTDVDGLYSFEDLFVGETFTVCEVAPAGQWAQSDVGGDWTLGACGNGDEEPDGHVITLAALTTADFGNFATVDVGCDFVSPPGEHNITFPPAGPFCSKDGDPDTAGLQDEEYVLESYTLADANATQVHDFHPLDGATTGSAIVTEVHVWSISQIQNTTKLFYNDDGGPVNREAEYCNHDPTDGAGNLVPALVPPNMTVLPGTHTTCIITSLESADGSRTDFLYSEIDGRRFF